MLYPPYRHVYTGISYPEIYIYIVRRKGMLVRTKARILRYKWKEIIGKVILLNNVKKLINIRNLLNRECGLVKFKHILTGNEINKLL